MDDQNRMQDNENQESKERIKLPKYVDQDLQKSEKEDASLAGEEVEAVGTEKETPSEEATDLEKEIPVTEQSIQKEEKEAQFSCSYEPPYGAPVFSSDVSPEKKGKKLKKKSKALIAILIAVGVLLAFVGGAWLGPILFDQQNSLQFPSGAANGQDEKKVYSSFSEVVAAVADSVVDIDVITVSGPVAGSGVIIDAKGYIITNEHVVENGLQMVVRLRNGIEYTAQYIGGDSKYDIAVLKISPASENELVAATIGKSTEMKVAEDVIAIGNPLGILGGTVTKGIISAKNLKIRTGFYPTTFLQIDAPISQGNSGGAIFNISGELIGIVNAKVIDADAGAEGLGFAIPVEVAWRCAMDLIEHGYVTGQPELGISIGITTAGVVITASNNEELKVNDQIIEINGKEVKSMDDIYAVTDRIKIGDVIELKVRRRTGFSYNDHDVSITVEEYQP